MRSEEFISSISRMSKENERFEELRNGLPLGEDLSGNIVLSQKCEKALTVRNTCVTGVGRSGFIRRLLITLSCLYEKNEANFLVLSPRTEYGELLRLHSIDITVPYIRSKTDLELALETVKELIRMREFERGQPRLFLVLDGLDELPDCNKNKDLEEYRAIFEMLSRKEGVDVISGVDLMKSIFSGYPGAFVGIGNCLVTTREEGKADVTYVQDDSSLSLPAIMTYPDSPSVTETVIFFNSLPKRYGEEAQNGEV